MTTKNKRKKKETKLDAHLKGVEHAAAEVEGVMKKADKDCRPARVKAGLHLLRARDAFAVENDGSRGNQHRKNLPVATVASGTLATLGGAEVGGFLDYLDIVEERTGLKRRTAYNLMNAAVNLGLDSKSGEGDVARMSAKLKKMDGAAWRALYLSPDAALEDDEGEEEEEEEETPAQLALSFVKETLDPVLKDVVDVVDDLPPRGKTMAKNKLLKALERVTGQNWREE